MKVEECGNSRCIEDYNAIHYLLILIIGIKLIVEIHEDEDELFDRTLFDILTMFVLNYLRCSWPRHKKHVWLLCDQAVRGYPWIHFYFKT